VVVGGSMSRGGYCERGGSGMVGGALEFAAVLLAAGLLALLAVFGVYMDFKLPGGWLAAGCIGSGWLAFGWLRLWLLRLWLPLPLAALPLVTSGSGWLWFALDSTYCGSLRLCWVGAGLLWPYRIGLG
jgi:hypothetical protein